MFDFLTVIPVVGGTLAFVVPFLIVISIVVAVHEYGHYIVGRWCGIHAEAFSLGFGPVLASWYDKRGTKWQIAALPLGGYVKFLGDANSASAGVDQEAIATAPDHLKGRSLYEAALWKRALTVAAGPAANLVLTVVIFTGLVLWSGIPSERTVVGQVETIPGVTNDLREGDLIRAINGTSVSAWDDLENFRTVTPPAETTYRVDRDGATIEVAGPYPWLPIVAGVNPVTPASKAGLRDRDLIYSVDGIRVRSFPQLQDIIAAAGLNEMQFVVQRREERLEFPLAARNMPFQKEDGSFGTRPMIGISGSIAIIPQTETVNPFRAAYFGSLQLVSLVEGWLRTIRELVTGGLALENLQGPVGIAQASGDTASQGLDDFIFLIAFISTAIGLMNLLPIPVLDGGHLVIYAYQAIVGREPPERVLQVAMGIGLCMLIALMVFATFNDINRL
ncbi:MAG: RIP metalloprotease RseP [Pseudomonadota bacterium]